MQKPIQFVDGPTIAEHEEHLRAAGARAFIQMVGESNWEECGLGSAALIAHAQDRMTARGREWRLAIVYPK